MQPRPGFCRYYALRRQVSAQQKELADLRVRDQMLSGQATELRGALAEASARTGAAEKRAEAAQDAASVAKARVAALEQLRETAEAARHRGYRAGASINVPAANDLSPSSAGLPLPGLPAGATSRDYLVAAQQAIRNSQIGKAQAALERAETRLLNQASLEDRPTKVGSHPAVIAIEQALDHLANRNSMAAEAIINRLLMH